jgi:AcrR family transcriptional regulator
VIARADSKTAILDAAERLFAELGFSATTIKKISEESCQNSALIYYYFDNKATLYRHVLDRIIGDLVREASRSAGGAATPDEVIRGVIRGQVAALSQRPHLPLLLTREIIDWKAAHAEQSLRQLSASLFERLCGAIEEGQRAGRFRREINPRFAAISVISQVAYLMLARPIAGILLGRGLEGPAASDIEAFGEHAAEFAMAALSGRAAQAQSPVAAARPGGGEVA